MRGNNDNVKSNHIEQHDDGNALIVSPLSYCCNAYVTLGVGFCQIRYFAGPEVDLVLFGCGTVAANYNLAKVF